MEIQKLGASKRFEQGKGPARRLRQTGKIPAVAYGKNLAALPIAVSPKELSAVLAGPHGRNSVVELDVDGGDKITAMVREYAHHPVTRAILHADFIQVALAEPVDVVVPFRLTGKSRATVQGGITTQVFRTLPVRCLPGQIPASIEYDMTAIDLNVSVKVAQLGLVEGVTVLLPAEQTVAAVMAPDKRGAEEDAAEAAAKLAAKPVAAAAAAAPAADKKKK